MRTTAALAAVVLLGALALWFWLPGQVHVERTQAPTSAGDPVAPVPVAAPAPRPSPAPVPLTPAGAGSDIAGGSRPLAARAMAEPGAGADTAPVPPPARGGPGPTPAQPAALGADTAPGPGQPPANPADASAPASSTPVLDAQRSAPALPTLDLQIPVAGIDADDLIDTYTDARSGGRSHDAIDIMAATGTPVLAVADGRIAKLFDSKQGGLTVYQFDATGALAYYYAHLHRYADGLAEGVDVRKGELIGYVGYSGNAHPDAPHLHFAIFVLGPERNWWQGTAINPYPYFTGR